MDLTIARFYADAHRAATIELAAHWPDEIGICLDCGEPYPCPAEWLTLRAISGIEAMWRRWAAVVTPAPAAAIGTVGWSVPDSVRPGLPTTGRAARHFSRDSY